jgi:hypothetical protein
MKVLREDDWVFAHRRISMGDDSSTTAHGDNCGSTAGSGVRSPTEAGADRFDDFR